MTSQDAAPPDGNPEALRPRLLRLGDRNRLAILARLAASADLTPLSVLQTGAITPKDPRR